MSDGLQVAIVTVAAAAALVALVRPYLRKPTVAKKATPSCANCAASSTAPAVRPSPSSRTTHS